MLKALEILGFKSFADRTRFEFPPGITVVVGPNGSGKSNIVDAIKWVLGEQSVKSLRGSEMTDVIFNGSGSRRALNAAEITLTFDNSKHLLPLDMPEVHITRRVYRSGEGEYLLNRAPARLRDIRDLLAGTGMGTQAYSVIEQGKVDALLQSSANDRRVIFEEAAGISRFKARKIEAIRRLERVQQNLLRLSDIVEEVDNRLRSVRAQAGKARRYKEHTDRLQELRTQVAQVDWKRLTDRLGEFEATLAELSQEQAAANAESERLGAQSLLADHDIAEITEQIRQAEAQIASHRERIAAAESMIDHERRRGSDLEQEIARHRRQVAAMCAKAGDLQQQLLETTESLQTAENNHRTVTQKLADAERKLTEVIADIDRLRNESEQRQAAHVRHLRTAAALGNEISALESQTAEAAAAQKRSSQRLDELQDTLKTLQLHLQTLQGARDEGTQSLQHETQLLTDAKQQLADSQNDCGRRRNECAELRQRYAGAVERAAVLEELVRRHEGLSDGVKDILAQTAEPSGPLFRDVVGLVADLFQVSVEAAPLVEIALGENAHHLVAARTYEILAFLQTTGGQLHGRAGFLWLESPASETEPKKDLAGQPGVLGRADTFVEAHPRCAGLVKRLLGRTWFVENLSHALTLADSAGAAGLTFVTLSGELLQPDGTLVVGPRNAAGGLIARRSQLRALQLQIKDVEAAIALAENDIAALDAQIAERQKNVDWHAKACEEIAAALHENRVALSAAEERRSQLDQQRILLDKEKQESRQRHEAAVGRLRDAQGKKADVDAALAAMETNLAELGRQLDEREKRRTEADRGATDAKVELAKSEERLRNLHARMRQFEENHDERHRAIAEARDRLAECSDRANASRWRILQAEAEIADLYLHKETAAAQTVTLIGRRESLQEQRTALNSDAQKIQGRIRKLNERIHAAELAAHEIRHERNALAGRLREDYGIELAQLEHRCTDEEQHQREEVQREIEELRQKINNLGNVNLEALEELEQLETRHKILADQYHDLVSAKNSLERIIDKINTDSRRLFLETLETVKGHFQTLFRDLFGGGRADIILDENVDVLDSGIEIVARPPGKEPRSISLLSGGEKTMTCVALLLAIFRSRPSPFCVLDEVDAALDEANIDRFTQVLKDFLAWTQFIIVTHSKKTMTCANTIYGVTMQESGVTKQVSVRFEDVSDDGHILTDRQKNDQESRAA